MTCKKEGCLRNTRNPNDFECWRNGLCPDHYWDKRRYYQKGSRFRPETV